MQLPERKRPWVILILGALSTVSPFSIDMYLPAFAQIASALHTNVAKIALSLSSYFIGLSLGQIVYGPLLDRFGRKRPLYIGLVIYILASLGCLASRTIESLIVFRLIQALGGCAAQVASMAMVRDFFPVKESAKIFSILVLILGVSPLLAPTLGGIMTTHFGWQSVFIALASIVFLILILVRFTLPEGHAPDPSVTLKIRPILANFLAILRHPQFYTYAFAGAFAFGGLLVYVAGAPMIFMDIFGLSAQRFGAVFATLSVGFIGGSQINIFLSNRYRSDRIFQTLMVCQCAIGLIFLGGSLLGAYGLRATILLFFGYLLCLGISSPNASALALAPFGKNAGSASALLGSIQIGLAALASSCVGLFNVRSSLPTIAVLATTSLIGLAILVAGQKRIAHLRTVDESLLSAH